MNLDGNTSLAAAGRENVPVYIDLFPKVSRPATPTGPPGGAASDQRRGPRHEARYIPGSRATRPGSRSNISSTAKHPLEWPTQKPLNPVQLTPLPRRAGSAGFPQFQHTAELDCTPLPAASRGRFLAARVSCWCFPGRLYTASSRACQGRSSACTPMPGLATRMSLA
jgi:hypothetical protein